MNQNVNVPGDVRDQNVTRNVRKGTGDCRAIILVKRNVKIART
jgi:hypothetical protein